MLALVQELSREDGQAAPLHLERHEVLLLVVLGVVDLVPGHAVDHFRPLVQLALVAARQAPEAPVIHRRVLEGDPKAEQGVRLRVEIGGVLVDVDLAPDLGRLEDGHGLHHERFVDARLVAELLDAGGVGDLAEDGIVLVQGVADLVDGLPLGHGQPALLPGLGLEEVAHLAGRVQEVFAEPVRALPRLPVEDRDLLGRGLEVVHEPVDLVHRPFADLGRDELRDEGVPLLLQHLRRLLHLLGLHLNLQFAKIAQWLIFTKRSHTLTVQI